MAFPNTWRVGNSSDTTMTPSENCPGRSECTVNEDVTRFPNAAVFRTKSLGATFDHLNAKGTYFPIELGKDGYLGLILPSSCGCHLPRVSSRCLFSQANPLSNALGCKKGRYVPWAIQV